MHMLAAREDMEGRLCVIYLVDRVAERGQLPYRRAPQLFIIFHHENHLVAAIRRARFGGDDRTQDVRLAARQIKRKCATATWFATDRNVSTGLLHEAETQ